MAILYRLFLWLYFLAIHLASFFSGKAKKWIEGRKRWREKLSSFRAAHPNQHIIWMHCASLGEFEQGRPVLEKLRKEFPDHLFVLTFFSPSGYEIRKNYPGADLVMYLPLDFPSSARDFISILKPSMAIFIKYEFWHYYLKSLKEQHIPALLVSGIFRPSQPFFHWWGNFHRGMLRCFTFLFVQDRDSANLLSKIGLTEEVVISGDTRFDRVIEIASANESVPLPVHDIEKKCLVAGSTWKEDELLLAAWHKKNPEWRMIIVPHEIHSSRIEEIKTIFPGSILFSELNNESIADSFNVIIVDKIGLLSKLYKAGSICYVGGGFSKNGHHNILEAAVYGKAVVTGPHYEKFRESVELKEIGGSFTVNNADELNEFTGEEQTIKLAGEQSKKYVFENAGATEKVVFLIYEKRLLTKE